MCFRLVFWVLSTGDVIGKLLACASMLPLVVIVGFVTLILFRRDLHTVRLFIWSGYNMQINWIIFFLLQIAFFAGLVANEGVNFVLKHTLRQPRPLVRDTQFNEFGMPSSHCQFLWFFSAYSVLFLWVRLHHINNNHPTVWMWKLLASFGCVIAAIITAFARYTNIEKTILVP